jgi:hypothetical protein
MGKYFTPRCMRLHAVAIVLVPTFLWLGRWQLSAALDGNELSWTYVIEWPAFAVMTVYLWWKLIHEQKTPLDRLWAARRRAEADASGEALYQIPGWAQHKELREAVKEQSAELARLPSFAEAEQVPALDSEAHKAMLEQLAHERLVAERSLPMDASVPDDSVVDARVLDERVEVHEGDEERDAYNEYLFRLSRYDES